MALRQLKTDPEVFQAMFKGRKTFELRYNDRNYQVGDVLLLKETKCSWEEWVETGAQSDPPLPMEYTGRELLARVTYILKGPAYGLLDGWCIMSTEQY